jgi:signal transduction histidine kinase
LRDKARQAVALRYQGLGYLTQGELTLALERFSQALALARQQPDPAIVGQCMSSIGLAYLELDNHALAVEYYHQGLALLRQARDEPYYALVMSNLGYLKDNLGQPDSAQYYFELAAPLASKHRPDFQAFIHNGLASLQLRRGQLTQARRNLALARAYAQRYDDRLDLADAARLSAERCLAQGLPDSALTYLDQSLQLARAGGLKRNLYLAYQLGSKIFETKNDLASALAYQRQATTYRDSVQSAKAQNALELFEHERQQGEAAQSQLKEQRQKLIAYASWAVLGLAVGLGLFFRKQYLKTRTINQELTSANLHLQETKEEVMAQNEELRLYQDEIKGLNDNLEQLLGERSTELAQRNQQLVEYAFFNAHGLRAPVATILGLYEVMRLTTDLAEREQIIAQIGAKIAQLDTLVRNNQQLLDQGKLVP